MEYTLGDDSKKNGGCAGRWKKNVRGDIIPLSTDEQALALLQLHKGDVAATQLQLLSDMGARKGEVG